MQVMYHCLAPYEEVDQYILEWLLLEQKEVKSYYNSFSWKDLETKRISNQN